RGRFDRPCGTKERVYAQVTDRLRLTAWQECMRHAEVAARLGGQVQSGIPHAKRCEYPFLHVSIDSLPADILYHQAEERDAVVRVDGQVSCRAHHRAAKLRDVAGGERQVVAVASAKAENGRAETRGVRCELRDCRSGGSFCTLEVTRGWIVE